MARVDRMSLAAGALGVTLAVAAGVGLSLLTGGTPSSPAPSRSTPAALPSTVLTPTTTAPTTPPASATSLPTTVPPSTPATPADGGATAAPSWLGTRVLPTDSAGHAAATLTPPELVDRRIVTVDVLPPPSDGAFHSSVAAVSAAVAARSSWTSACPVKLSDLRYVTVVFRGFDGRAHTGELLVNRSAAAGAVQAFGRLFAAGFPIERMVIATRAEVDAPPTGDGNTTGSYACRPVARGTSWSEHAYGRAIDVNPFQNPYIKGDAVLPELATAYTDRARVLPGMILPGSAVVKAFAVNGFSWGGDYRSLKDWMHFSTTGR
jgi:hypothetical protein